MIGFYALQWSVSQKHSLILHKTQNLKTQILIFYTTRFIFVSRVSLMLLTRNKLEQKERTKWQK